MIKEWFESKVQYIKVDEISGKEKKVTECFLFDAVSWTDAEAKTYKEMEQLISGEFSIANIKKSSIAEVYPYDSGEYWFEAVVGMITTCDTSGKETVSDQKIIVMADNIRQALDRTEEIFESWYVPCTISDIGISNIVDVFPYFEEEKDQ